MKISPLGGATHGSVDTGRTSPERIARAKSIAMGQQPQEEEKQESPQQKLPTLQMKTNVSPDRVETQGIETTITPEASTAETHAVVPTNDNIESTQQAEETRPLSPQFAALAKQKRALQIERAALDKEKAALEGSKPNMADYISKADLNSRTLDVLQENGITYDKLTEAILQNPQPMVDPKKLSEQIKAELLKELDGKLTSRDDQQKQAVLAEIDRDVARLTATGDEFEAIRQAKAQGHVRDLIDRTFSETGEVLETRHAAELVENQLIDEAIQFANLKKIQSRLAPKQEPVAEVMTPKPGTKVMRTLTNRDSAVPIFDRRARAIAAFNGSKKG